MTHSMLSKRLDATLERIVRRLARARRLLFVTGAGMSADSGLPTYRGVGGLYDGVETVEGMPIEVALSGDMMSRRPELCWKYILQIEQACRGARPNRGHHAIAELERRFEVWVLTQNVDGLHRSAGSKNIVDIHGDVRQLVCARCAFERWVESFEGLDCPPRCPECDAVLRPDVVLFGEMLPADKVTRLREQLLEGFDVVFSVGTSSVFPYIAEPVLDARRRGALTVEINPSTTEVSHAVEEKLDSRAAEVLGALALRL
jgi:NAD-dependent protein deacetylase/lipoamidase